MKRVAFLAVAVTVLTGCGIMVSTSTVSLEVDCAMTNTQPSLYAYSFAVNGGALNSYTLPANTRHFTYKTGQRGPGSSVDKAPKEKQANELVFKIKASSEMGMDSFISCSALCMNCAPGTDVPNPEVGKCGPTKHECEIHIIVVRVDDGYGVQPR